MKTLKLRTLALATCTAFAVQVAGCGGSSSSGPTADSLSIAPLATQTVNQGTTVGPLALVIQGGDAGSVAVTATADNPALVRPGSVSIRESEGRKTLTVVPEDGQTGTTRITVTASDVAGHTTVQSFELIVNPVYVAFDGFATSAFADGESAEPRSLSASTLQLDASDNPDAFDSLLQ